MVCMKKDRIWSYSGPHFPAFGLNSERYFVSLCIQFEYGKRRTRITPNKDTFYAVMDIIHLESKQRCIQKLVKQSVFAKGSFLDFW